MNRRWTLEALRRAARPLAAAVGLAALLTAPAARAALVVAAGPQPGNLPIYVAEAQGYFAAEGVAVRVLPCAFGKLCLRLALDGQAQLATVADLPLVLAAYAGERYAVVATINTNRNDTKIVTRRDSGIRRAADLVGRSVGVYAGTTSQYALDSLLLFEGADPSRIKLAPLQPGEGRTRLLARTIDAAALFEPYAFEAAQALGDEAVVIDIQRIYTQTWNLVATVGPAAPAPADTEALLRALARASDWIAAHPADAKLLLRERLRIDAELVEASWPWLDYSLRLEQSLLTTLEGESRWAERLGLVQGARPNYLRFVQTGPLRRTRPARVTIAE